MNRIKRGWRLAKDSWAVLKADRSLTIFPVLSFVSAATAFALIMAPGVVVAATAEQEWIAVPFFLVASYLATFATVYFNVALTGAAVKSMGGQDTGLRDGLAVARERRGLIAKWALVQWAVGLLIRVLQNAGDRGGVGQLVSAVVSSLVGAAWAIASFFVIPVLALEGLGPKDALKRSIGVIRERWGEGIVGHATIGGAVFLVGVLPALLVGGLGYVSLESVPVLGVGLLAVAVLALIAVGVIGSALNVIFRLTLFRYATEGRGSNAFADEDLAAAFGPKKGRRG
ncbi:MAG TPA: DUF6159 family protein [Thermoleophilaceae bacterium]|nr:DUF6159 family protein [Thermoleophilaceae bacterium]